VEGQKGLHPEAGGQGFELPQEGSVDDAHCLRDLQDQLGLRRSAPWVLMAWLPVERTALVEVYSATIVMRVRQAFE
jgi:hypothetical protein